MIYIFAALYQEAYGLIRAYDLKKNMTQKRFQVFENEEKGICLTITGSGAIAAATAVSSIATEKGVGEADFLVNIGTCAANVQQGVFLCNQIREACTGRTFYPDLLYAAPFGEAAICTVSQVITQVPASALEQKEEGTVLLYDMEASAVYQAGSYFFPPHKMSFLKIVSDQGTSEKIDPVHLQEMPEAYLPLVKQYLETLVRSCADIDDDYIEKEQLETASREFCCSATMQANLKQIFTYCTLAKVDYKKVLEGMRRAGALPCKNRREGKQKLEQFKRAIL